MQVRDSQQLQALPRNKRLIWMALISSLVALGILVEGLQFAKVSLTGVGEGMSIELMRYALGAVALMTGIGILAARKILTPEGRHTPTTQVNSVEAQKRTQREFTVWIISMAMADSISLYGLVLFFLGGQRMDFYLFTIPALLLMLMLRPNDGVRRI